MKQRPELVDEDAYDSSASDDEEWTVEVEGSPYKFPLLAKFGIGLGALFAATLAVIATMPLVLPASSTINLAEKLISSIVGIDVKINGPHSFRVLPSLRLHAEGIVHAEPASGTSLSLKRFEVGMSTLGALSGSVDIDRVMLIEPKIQFAQPAVPQEIPTSEPEIDRAWGWWRDMRLADVIVKDASVVMSDSDGIGSYRLEQFSLQTVAPISSEPQDGIALDGKGVLNNQPVDIHIMTSNPQLLVTGNRWPMNVSLKSQYLTGSFEGSLAIRERMVGDGKLELESKDALALNTWIGPFLPARNRTSVALSANVSMAGDVIDVSQFNLRFAETLLSGNFQVTSALSERRQINGKLDASVIDLGDGYADISGAIYDAPLSVQRFPVGNIALSWTRAIWRDVEIGRGRATIERPPETNRVSLTVEKAALYGGTLRGKMTLDNSEGMRALNIEAKAVGVSAGPLLSSGEAETPPVFDGNTTLDVSLFSVGGTLRQLIEALTGKAQLVATDGVVVVPALTAQVTKVAGDELSFHSFNGGFEITQGIATSEDLLLKTDGLSLVGKGRIDLANGTIDLNVGRLNSEGGSRTLKRYRVSGPAKNIRVEAINGS